MYLKDLLGQLSTKEENAFPDFISREASISELLKLYSHHRMTGHLSTQHRTVISAGPQTLTTTTSTFDWSPYKV